MAEPSLMLENGSHGCRPIFDCRNCDVTLGLDPDSFNVTLGAVGVTVSPEWFCPNCGVRGSIVRGLVRVTGRISIPPSGAKRATMNPGARPAIRLERRPESDETEPVPNYCKEKFRHQVFIRQKLPECPVCETKF